MLGKKIVKRLVYVTLRNFSHDGQNRYGAIIRSVKQRTVFMQRRDFGSFPKVEKRTRRDAEIKKFNQRLRDRRRCCF